MARPPRIDLPDGLYHVTSRGNGRAAIFWTDDDRLRFLDQLADNVQTAAVVLYAYVLMHNHFHLLVRTPRANLSRFMQRLITSYALYARYRHRRPGHQFQGRFKAKLVQDDDYLLALTRYIHLNPIKTAACRRLGPRERVRRLEAYRWSSYPGYVDRSKTEAFVAYDVLREYGRKPAIARLRYRAYVHACVLDDDQPILSAMAASRYAVGDETFLDQTQRLLARRHAGRVQDADLALPKPSVDVGLIDAQVAADFHVAPEQLQMHGHRGGLAKFAAVELACRLTGLTQRDVGQRYGNVTSAAVSIIRRKIRSGLYPLSAVVERLQQNILHHPEMET
jgi:REP element-mobilizing transposase RayT